jgi:CHAD domain-containing protein
MRPGAVDGDQHPRLLRALGLAPSDPPRVDPKSSPRRQLAAMLQVQYQAILAHDPGTRLGTDPEELHQHRVAVRRLRALLRAARPMLDREWADGLREDLRWVGAALGEVRDLDVLIEHLEDDAAELETEDALAFAPVLAVLANRREAARALMLAELRDPRYILLLERLERELAYPPEAGKTLKPRAIAAAEFRRLRKQRRRIGREPEDTELHELRIQVKRARYAAELAAPSRGAKARRFVKDAKRLQDVLGEHQDAVVAAEKLRELAVATGDPRAALSAGLVIAHQADRRDAAREEFPDAWRELKRSGKRAWR